MRVKICGLTRRADAEAAIEAGADYLGFNFEPTSPRFIESPPAWLDDLGDASLVAVFGRARTDLGLAGFDFVQAAAGETGVYCLPTIQAIRLRAGDTSVELPIGCDMLLLDAWHEHAYGGTGIRVDWPLAASIVKRSAVPVILAGGLTPDNVAEAVRSVRPFAVDVSSGVESEKGIKDMAKVRDFIAAAKGV